MNGPVGKGGSAIMTVSMSQSHTQKAMLRKSRRRRKKRRECQKGNLVHVLRAHPQLHQSAPGRQSGVCVARRQRLPLPDHQCSPSWYWLSWWQKSGAGITANDETRFRCADWHLQRDRRKRQKCLQPFASETPAASSSSSQVYVAYGAP